MSLVGEERKDYILNQLNLEGKVTTNDLVERLNVSSETIRRYLEELEEEKKLKRVYGGAVKINLSRDEPSHLKREVLHADEKRRIGRAAATIVEDNDVLFIDDGTTTLHIIDYLLNKKNITVLTISIPALILLIDYKNKGLFSGDIYLLGGQVNAMHSRVSGTLAEKMVENFHADKAFLSVDGMMLGKGITGFEVGKGQMTQQFMKYAKQSIALCDHSKFGLVQFYKIADLGELDMIVSDVPAPKEWESELEKKGVVWVSASE
ncbi:DeoR/GlpR family DNA-binding transcription regulator [Paenibacillus sp. GCM10023248]|uniref:DeoR/GlpR family DNA-binding transcription regulator n=1 Tax=Bacillales TaxID=1385 RepID=UPI002378DF93|nr:MULTISPECIES: DeoR/GlpR family DNA-binding transcription regulator [Bacillales]MDD9265884.1 DeoR/GlpR family DNA-binding transcription regulator [Paenibacillus sp. MAHUQ-63]MDR6879123.1 DeoR/GlpR family transcriptional regulator of sugar metabolism [Bacillus sp. 3255]